MRSSSKRVSSMHGSRASRPPCHNPMHPVLTGRDVVTCSLTLPSIRSIHSLTAAWPLLTLDSIQPVKMVICWPDQSPTTWMTCISISRQAHIRGMPAPLQTSWTECMGPGGIGSGSLGYCAGRTGRTAYWALSLPVGQIGRLHRSFSHIYPISLSANAIQGSCCTIHVVLPVSTTNSSPTACRTHNSETHNPREQYLRPLLQTFTPVLLGSCWIASRVLGPYIASDRNLLRLSWRKEIPYTMLQ